MKCNCGSTNFYIEKNSNNTGLYCSKCGKWQKWLNKDETRLYEHKKDDSNIIKNLKEFIDALDEEIDKQYEIEPLSIRKCAYATAYEKVKVALENILDGRRFCDDED